MSQTPVYSQWQTNLTSAQRLGIIAAIAVSSSLVLMVYANKKHRLHCLGPVDSPKDQRFKCPLSFLTCGVDTSNASGMAGSGSEGDPISPNERELEDATSLRGLSCPHNSGVAGSEMCLQCEERRFITILERSRMAQWSWCSPALSPAMATNSPPDDDVQSPGAASTSSCASFISVASHYGANSLGDHIGMSCVHDINPDFHHDAIPMGRAIEYMDSGPAAAYTRRTIGKTMFYVIFWYISTSGIDRYKLSDTGSILHKFPAPHLLQAIYFASQAFFSFEVRRRWGQGSSIPEFSWNLYLFRVLPTAVATTIDKAIDLPHEGIPEQFGTLCKSGAPLFVLILAYLFQLEAPTFKLTAGVASLTTGSLLTIAKALDQSYDVRDLFSLMVGAFISAFRWAGVQNLIQKEGFKTPLAALGSLSPQMAITTIAFSLVFEPSWNIIKMHEVFASWQNMMYALGRIFILCILSTLEVVAELLLIAKTSAVTFITVKLMKNISNAMNKLVEKGWFYEYRWTLSTHKNMNEETIGLHYFALGLVLITWHRYQIWAQTRSDIIAGIQTPDTIASMSPRGGANEDLQRNWTWGVTLLRLFKIAFTSLCLSTPLALLDHLHLPVI